ncbi:MAG: DUF362 domain-containing protein [marine benthic group bacterium]|nr:DUF362 domain-containing protein [Gemmatimonadota bacterium]MCL7967125.1 DUF362 domain-containing protein [Gemmatimonadota bacterium]MCL7979832.1 DUF362 domain-containing protein [Gemmatimonadota bacterium]MCL7985672.1 DUF362 domain-containing protein [Gemmatimonadota bacterium]
MPDRREFVRVTGGATIAIGVAGCRTEKASAGRPWHDEAFTKRERSEVVVLAADRYDGTLPDLLTRGLGEFPELHVRGRRVLLKPNLVEVDAAGVINTHPLVVHAAIEAFRRAGAAEVVVGEGPGHRRDTEYLLLETELGPVLRDTGARFVDLNLDDVTRVPLLGRFGDLGSLYLPNTLLDTDLLVSMPKLKTHHWAGVTLSMKNMFGIVPGSVYGWPKNALHMAGIGNSILDINATLAPRDRFAIVDGIVGMDGNGPIQGEPRPAGVIAMGRDPVAVDATCCRLMKIAPERVDYLARAAAFLGNLREDRIDQRAEAVQGLQTDFRVIDQFASLKAPEIKEPG